MVIPVRAIETLITDRQLSVEGKALQNGNAWLKMNFTGQK
jgi:hypothetical protein